MTPLIEEVQTILNELTERTRELEAQGKLLELFAYLNTPATDQLMFANIAGLGAQQGSRICVLVGAAHLRLLSQFVLESPKLHLVDPLPCLQGVV